ncbi:MAG: hypothetical protein H7263_06290 [Candidatus Sericytochromatia bacterium]|nr:hypothetical protein [Candidatus Sericytochromatia bacterium]
MSKKITFLLVINSILLINIVGCTDIPVVVPSSGVSLASPSSSSLPGFASTPSSNSSGSTGFNPTPIPNPSGSPGFNPTPSPNPSGSPGFNPTPSPVSTGSSPGF